MSSNAAICLPSAADASNASLLSGSGMRGQSWRSAPGVFRAVSGSVENREGVIEGAPSVIYRGGLRQVRKERIANIEPRAIGQDALVHGFALCQKRLAVLFSIQTQREKIRKTVSEVVRQNPA